MAICILLGGRFNQNGEALLDQDLRPTLEIEFCSSVCFWRAERTAVSHGLQADGDFFHACSCIVLLLNELIRSALGCRASLALPQQGRNRETPGPDRADVALCVLAELLLCVLEAWREMPVPDEALPELTFNDEDVERILRDPDTYPQAVEALTQIRVGREKLIPSADGLDTSSVELGIDRAELWIQVLRHKGCLSTLVVALRARGILLVEGPAPAQDVDEYSTMFDPVKLSAFLARLDSFRCMVRVKGQVKGSGILVGPSSVLTAWHVIAKEDAKPMQESVSKIDVVLADGRRVAVALLSVSSPCSSVEWARAPENDDEVEDHHDVALLRLKAPVGIHLTYAALASPPYTFNGAAGMVLVSHPQGEWRGVEFARLQRLRNLTARWGYDVRGNRGGSSGGGCFDTQFALAGIHQGRAQSIGRLVPLIRFHGQVREAIDNDELPPLLWSLDGTPQSSLIVGRDAFFVGYQAAMRGPQRTRGLWIRRVDLTNDQSGLPFSYQMLESLIARSPSTRLIRISFDAIVHDLPNEIARRATEAGLALEAPAAQAGAGVDQTEPEAMVADRARRIALSLNQQAHDLCIRLWVFFDHPAVMFGDEARWAVTAFVDQALRLDNLRIALAGFEPVQMPGAQFDSPGDALGDGPPGLMIEYLTDVNRDDVRNLIATATRDLKRPVSVECAQEWADEALEDLEPVNGWYDSVLRSTIAARLQKRLQKLCNKVPRP